MPVPLEAFTLEPASCSSALLQPLGSSKAAVHGRKRFEGSIAWEPHACISGWSQPSTGFLYTPGPRVPRQPHRGRDSSSCSRGPLCYATHLQWWSPPKTVAPAHQCLTSNLRAGGSLMCLPVTEAEPTATNHFSSVVESRSVLVWQQSQSRCGFAQ